VALPALVALVLISCGGKSPKEDAQATAQATTRHIASWDAARRLLDGNGIGSITFGQSRSAVTPDLERLLGPPHKTIPGICGFGRTTDWIDLNINSHDPDLSAQLTLNFKTRPVCGLRVFCERRKAGAAAARVLLATAGGLTLGDTVTHARQQYRRAFIETSVRQGTPPSATLRQDRVTARSTVVSIGAGAGPNTPCR
jgi:hypothetical protein